MATIAKTLAGFLLYIVLLLAIDSDARELIKLIWQEIIVSLKQLLRLNSGQNNAVATEN